MATNAKEVYKRWDALKEKRQLFDQHWQELSDYFIPNKNNITRESSPGEKRMLHIYDSTGIHANKTLAAMLHGVLTNPSAYWFEFTTGIPELDKIDAVRKWLQTSARIIHEIMNNSNFQTEIHEMYLDLGSIGTSTMFIEKDSQNIVRFSTKPMKNIWVDENAQGFIDTIFHSFKWKPRQILQEFGEKMTPKFVLDKMRAASEDEIELLQLIEPNGGYVAEKKLSVEGKKFKSCTYIKDGANEHTLKESGFNTFPAITPRWSKGSGEVYGRSPAMECLAEAKMINEMMKETIRAQQKATNPPLLVPDDGIVGSLRLTPGGINYYRAGSGDFIKPLQTEVNLVLSFQMLDDVRKRIRDCFFWDQMQLKDGPQMTATEVMQRNEDNVRLMGPVLGRQQSESGKPLIERVYEVCEEAGVIPPAPAELKNNRKISIKYRGMMAKAQLTTEAQNLQRVFQAAGPFFQLDPNVSKVINAEEGVRYVAGLYGLPVELIRDKAELEAMQQAQDEANQAALQAQQEQAAVDQVATVAPAVKMASEMGAPRQ